MKCGMIFLPCGLHSDGIFNGEYMSTERLSDVENYPVQSSTTQWDKQLSFFPQPQDCLIVQWFMLSMTSLGFNYCFWSSRHQAKPKPGISGQARPEQHYWNHIKMERTKYPRQAKGVWEIWERVAEVWGNIEPEVCQNLIRSRWLWLFQHTGQAKAVN